MTIDAVTVSRRGHVATLTLNRPDQANTLNAELMAQLRDAQVELGMDDSVRVVLVTGAGRHFCGGADLKEASAGVRRRLDHRLTLDYLPQPSIAVINGAAMGGGCELALACDFRIMASTAKIGLPEIRFGALPLGGGTARLPRVVGPSAAKRLIMTGEAIDAAEALRIGLVDQVAEPDALLETAMAFAEQLAVRAPYAVRTAKVLVDKALDVDVNTAIALERSLVPTMATPEQRAAAQAEAASKSATYSRIFDKATEAAP